VPAEGLERDAELDGGGPQATVVLRDEQGVDAEVCEPTPERQPGLVVSGRPGAGGLDRVGSGKQRLEGVAEVSLVGGQLELHPRGSRGRPRMRSATMLRWISLVPA
jgi:hypothetical protein